MSCNFDLKNHGGKNEFKSNICNFNLSEDNDMQRHTGAVHEGNKSFKCGVCNLFFSGIDDLQRHFGAAHEGKKSSKCEKDRAPCGCLKGHFTSIIDNAYLSISEVADLQVLEDAISDHYPIMVNLNTKLQSKSKLKTISRRDISRLLAADLEEALESKDWSPMYSTNDTNKAVDILVSNINEALDVVAPEKEIKI